MPVIVEVRQFLTKASDTRQKPVPCRKMKGEIVRETAKAVLVKLHGFIAPSTSCLHCGRTLTHPVSLLYGIGPICGEHFHINPLNSEEELQAKYDEMASKMAKVTWEGWLPKGHISMEAVNA